MNSNSSLLHGLTPSSDTIAFAANLWWRLALALWAVGGALAAGVAVTYWMGP